MARPTMELKDTYACRANCTHGSYVVTVEDNAGTVYIALAVADIGYSGQDRGFKVCLDPDAAGVLGRHLMHASLCVKEGA